MRQAVTEDQRQRPKAAGKRTRQAGRTTRRQPQLRCDLVAQGRGHRAWK
jgi:hypothetical protein